LEYSARFPNSNKRIFNSHGRHTKAIRVNDDRVSLTKEEAELAAEIARRFDLTVEEATTLIVKACIARRMKKRTGKNPAKVYGIRGSR
jgi:ribosomal protein L23